MGETHPGLEKSSGLLRQCPNSVLQSDAARKLLLWAVLWTLIHVSPLCLLLIPTVYKCSVVP